MLLSNSIRWAAVNCPKQRSFKFFLVFFEFLEIKKLRKLITNFGGKKEEEEVIFVRACQIEKEQHREKMD